MRVNIRVIILLGILLRVFCFYVYGDKVVNDLGKEYGFFLLLGKWGMLIIEDCAFNIIVCIIVFYNCL